MLKRLLLTAVATLLFVFQLNISSAGALELTEEARTVKYNDAGDEIVLTLQQVKKRRTSFC